MKPAPQLGGPEIGPPRVIEQDHERRQILIDRAQPVAHPRAEARIALAQIARVHLDQAGAVREAVGVGAADDGEIIDATGEVRIEVRDLDAGLSVLRELARRAEEGAGFADLEQRIAVEVRHRLAAVLAQLRLGVPGIDLAHSAIHEQADDRFRFRRVVRLTGCERIVTLRHGLGGLGGAIEESILAEERSQCESGEAAAGFPEELPTCAAAGCRRRHGRSMTIQAHTHSPGHGRERFGVEYQ